MAYASGKYAKAMCDRCGFEYEYTQLKKEWNGLKTCPTCFEPKHPQLEPLLNFLEPEALRDPRPDNDKEVGLGKVVTTSDPIGKTISSFQMASSVGTLSVVENDSSVSQTLSSLSASSSLGSVTVTGNLTTSVTVTGLQVTALDGSPTITSDTVYTVTVASYLGGNRYYIDGVVYPTLTLSEGETYRFDQSDSSNGGHPLRFSTTADGTHGGGSEYTTGVTTNGTPGSSGAYTQITVAVGAPTLYYYCTNHSGMGGTANTP